MTKQLLYLTAVIIFLFACGTKPKYSNKITPTSATNGTGSGNDEIIPPPNEVTPEKVKFGVSGAVITANAEGVASANVKVTVQVSGSSDLNVTTSTDALGNFSVEFFALPASDRAQVNVCVEKSGYQTNCVKVVIQKGKIVSAGSITLALGATPTPTAQPTAREWDVSVTSSDASNNASLSGVRIDEIRIVNENLELASSLPESSRYTNANGFFTSKLNMTSSQGGTVRVCVSKTGYSQVSCQEKAYAAGKSSNNYSFSLSPLPPAPATVDLYADGFKNTSVSFNGKSNLTWSATNVKAGSCTLNNAAVGSAGSLQTPELQAQAIYTFTCVGLNNAVVSTFVTISVGVAPAPTSNLLANGVKYAYLTTNSSATMSWQTTNVKSCTLNSANVAVNGSQQTPALTVQTLYTLSCIGYNNVEVLSFATVVINPPAPPPPTILTVRQYLDSNNMRYEEWSPAGSTKILSVTLITKSSSSPCNYGSSYGITGGGTKVYVDKGCRATFDIRYQ